MLLVSFLFAKVPNRCHCLSKFRSLLRRAVIVGAAWFLRSSRGSSLWRRSFMHAFLSATREVIVACHVLNFSNHGDDLCLLLLHCCISECPSLLLLLHCCI